MKMPTTPLEWFEYLKANESNIYVRGKNSDGKWDSIALSELSPALWAKHVDRWIEEGWRIPVAVIPTQEQSK